MGDRQTIEADYWRNHDGTIVHTNECIHSESKGSWPWNYAQGETHDWVRALVRDVVWLRLCKRCWKDTDG